MPHYFIYGLYIYTKKPLQGLPACKKSTKTDLTINWSTEKIKPISQNWKKVTLPISRYRKRVQLWQLVVPKLPSPIRIQYSFAKMGIVECLINGKANQLWIHYAKGTHDGDLCSFILGTILGAVLRRQGIVCLHASVVTINRQGILLMGASKAGKSTTAAALIKYADAHLIADDIAVIYPKQDELTVQTGYSGLRLEPTTLTHLFNKQANTLAKVYTTQTKRYLFFDTKTQQTNLKNVNIERIFILQARDERIKQVHIQPLSESESLLQLLSNTYASYAIFDKENLGHELNVLAQLLKKSKVHRIQCPSDLNALPKLCQKIIAYNPYG